MNHRRSQWNLRIYRAYAPALLRRAIIRRVPRREGRGILAGARGDRYPRDRFGARLLETRDQEPEKFLAKFDFVCSSTGGTLEIFRSVLHREYYNFEIAGQPSNSLSNLFEICSIYEILQSTK